MSENSGVSEYPSNKGELLCEGKTKQIYAIKGENLVLVESKDRITAGDGAKSHQMKDKSIYSTRTNGAIFNFLNKAGVPTSFHSMVKDHPNCFIARRCQMIPIEWVTRRLATGSFLKRHPNVKEGYRFNQVKLETFYKDDANHDPYWSIESIKEAQFPGLRKLHECEIDQMCHITKLVFHLLERVWQTKMHQLVDMKVEFGIDMETDTIVLSDVIDNDSWRLWPNGDKRLMLDKQVYRNMTDYNEEAMEKLRSNFALVADLTHDLFTSLAENDTSLSPTNDCIKFQNSVTMPQVGIIMGSASDRDHVVSILKCLENLGITRVQVNVSSAHKSTEFTLQILDGLSQWPSCKCIIAVAGRSNGLGLVAAANSTIPVINCPPMKDSSTMALDVWSSLRAPSGLGCGTVLSPEQGALAAAHIVANEDPMVWARLKTRQIRSACQLLDDDHNLNLELVMKPLKSL